MFEGYQTSSENRQKAAGPSITFSSLEQGKMDGVREADLLLQSKCVRGWEFGHN